MSLIRKLDVKHEICWYCLIVHRFDWRLWRENRHTPQVTVRFGFEEVNSNAILFWALQAKEGEYLVGKNNHACKCF